jgi:hypothetical protein
MRTVREVRLQCLPSPSRVLESGMSVALSLSVAVENEAEAAVLKLLAYCRANDWAGYDPYDALNSRLFTACRG